MSLINKHIRNSADTKLHIPNINYLFAGSTTKINKNKKTVLIKAAFNIIYNKLIN